MRYFLSFSYNGSNFHGWQIQINAVSVQQEIEYALSKIIKKEIKITGAGRTDKGVHAKLMVAHFDAKISNEMENSLLFNLNQFLNNDIYFFELQKVKDDAHARFDAISRTYQYHISSVKNPFKQGLVYYFREKLNLQLMNEASEILMSFNDFKAFSKTNTDVKTFECEITKAEWVHYKDEVVFKIKSNRFLRNMVRAVVGTILNVGLNKINLVEFSEIIKSRISSKAGYSVPVHILFLCEIEYEKKIFINE